MYINKIDKLVDKIIDDFYNIVIIKNKDFKKISSDINFVKFQKKINDMLINYNKNIDVLEIEKLVTHPDNVITIKEMVKRYIAYYFFLFIGFLYPDNKNDTYINNIIEYSKNQYTYDYKIDNFFNSFSNSNIINFYMMMRNIVILLKADKSRRQLLAKKDEYKSAVTFLNEYGAEFVTAKFKLENIGGNVYNQGHNIIKSIILNELYKKQEKKDVFNILESIEKEKGEYIFIDVIIPKISHIDFSIIESVLDKSDADSGLSYDIYDMLIKLSDVDRKFDLSQDEKILELINNNILVPITEEILLYHKNTERYDKFIQMEPGRRPKKEETKIRYIVGKINNASELYSESVQKNPDVEKKIKKLFYMPLMDRKVVLINDIEEIGIIKKLRNQGKKAIENNEYYNDLITYRLYSYTNFRDFSKHGFRMIMNKTIDAVRYISFDNSIPRDKNNVIEFRIGSDEQVLNIVGFMISTNIVPLQCLKIKNINDIRTLKFGKDKYNNGFDGIIRFIKHILFKRRKYKTSIYWLFDNNKDSIEIDQYEQITKMTDSQQIKLIISKIYDKILAMIYDKVMNIMDKKKNISLYQFDKLISKIDNNILKIPRYSDIYNKLKHTAYYDKYIESKKEYDENEDKFHGLYGDIKKLPSAPKIKPPKILVIDLKKIKEKVADELYLTDAEKYNAICQHNITWEKITALRKKNPNKYVEDLFNFISRYAIENDDGDFVCRSCGIEIDIQNYKNDGVFDDSGRYITFNTPLNIPLENIREYEKYGLTIKNLDKKIELIAIRCNIPYLTRSTPTIKARRRKIVKNIIDILLSHNRHMMKIYKGRSEKIVKLYGIIRGTSHLFSFILDDSIFKYSSKDKDTYKTIKRNNVLVYTILMMMLELNDSQIVYMGGNKTCNYNLFDKFGYNMFSGLKIMRNNQGDVVPIQKYKVLCYIIYYMSCIVTRYHMWRSDIKPTKPKKFDPFTQKTIIITLIDLINSIIEVYNKNKDNYIYKILYMKFFTKLNSMYLDRNLLKKISNLQKKKIVVINKKRRYRKSTYVPMVLPEKFKRGDYNGIVTYDACNLAKYYIPRRNIVFDKYYNITNITNCKSGEFHNWIPKGKILECSICNERTDTIKYNQKVTEIIINNYRIIKLKSIAKQYCKSGKLHNFIYDSKSKCLICKKCEFINADKLTLEQLEQIYKNVVALKKKIVDDDIKHIKYKDDKFIEKQKSMHNVISELKISYGKSKSHREDYFNHINKFIRLLESIIGKNINIHNKNIYLNNDAYIINHDHNGYELRTPIIIINKRQGFAEQRLPTDKIKYKSKHSFFKTDVLFYTNYKLGRIDIFYDSSTYLLLGYKEQNKNYQYAKVKNRYIIVNYSILNRLKMLGYISKNIDITNKVSKQKHYYKNDKQQILRNILSDIGRKRILNLKKVIMDIQRYIYKMIYHFNLNGGTDDEINLDKEIIDRYKTKLNKVVLTNKNKTNIFMKDWNAIKSELFYQNLKNKTINLNINAKYLAVDDISNYDYHGNLILYYIIREFTKLINYNQQKITKIHVIYFIIDIIIKAHNIFNEDYKITNFYVKRFSYIAKSETKIFDIEERGHGIGQLNDMTGEYIEDTDEISQAELEQREIDMEEQDALDIDGELDYAIDYAAGINYG
uniref:Uncharacterized protein n=1 Tax=Mimivirus LCMiAC01 TaxID=2506608 RepID=A0A481Z0S9_9VIRU|nr:MAG: uncharacterized protein LCMiAC01_00580 [Mimivirus LCMiAC01]